LSTSPERLQAGPEQRRSLDALPPDWTEFVAELNRQPKDHVVTKRTWGAFMNTDLDAHLRGLDVTQVVIAGSSTSSGVESTARLAYELGFNVTLAIDAMTDLNPDTHFNSVTRIFPKLGEIGTAQQIVDLIKARSA
jgi:nicotinamidase-related amidase